MGACSSTPTPPTPREFIFLDVHGAPRWRARVLTDEESKLPEDSRRRRERRLIGRADRSDPAGGVWFCVDTAWLRSWLNYVSFNTPPPGPITNDRLFSKKKLSKVSKLRSGLKLARDYRCVNQNVWFAFHKRYGGGPALARHEMDIYSAEVSAEELEAATSTAAGLLAGEILLGGPQPGSRAEEKALASLQGAIAGSALLGADAKFDKVAEEQAELAAIGGVQAALATAAMGGALAAEQKLDDEDTMGAVSAAFAGGAAAGKLMSSTDEEVKRDAAARMLQAAWRRRLAQKQVAARRAQLQAKKEVAAARMLQAAWRGLAARRRVAQLAEEKQRYKENAAAIMLQAAWRRRHARKVVRDEIVRRAAQRIQLWWRMRQAKKLAAQLRGSVLRPLHVTVHSASKLPRMDAGSGAGGSDPYVVVTVMDIDGHTQLHASETSVIKNNREPVWEQDIILPGVTADMYLVLTVLDWDRFKKPDVIGQVAMRCGGAFGDGELHDYELPLGPYHLDLLAAGGRSRGLSPPAMVVGDIKFTVSECGALSRAHCGVLHKKGAGGLLGSAEYRERWFALDAVRSKMHYFEAYNGPSKGSIDLLKATEVVVVGEQLTRKSSGIRSFSRRASRRTSTTISKTIGRKASRELAAGPASATVGARAGSDASLDVHAVDGLTVFDFNVVTPDRTWQLRSTSQRDLDIWVSKIRMIMRGGSAGGGGGSGGGSGGKK